MLCFESLKCFKKVPERLKCLSRSLTVQCRFLRALSRSLNASSRILNAVSRSSGAARRSSSGLHMFRGHRILAKELPMIRIVIRALAISWQPLFRLHTPILRLSRTCHPGLFWNNWKGDSNRQWAL